MTLLNTAFCCLIWLLILPTTAAACVLPPSVEDRLEKSDSVFAGKVTEVKCDGTTGFIKFDFNKIWKGKEITQNPVMISCFRYEISKDKEYLVFAKKTSAGKALIPLDASNSCLGSIEQINSRWKEWFLKEAAYLEANGKPFWSFSIKGSAYRDIEDLNKLAPTEKRSENG